MKACEINSGTRDRTGISGVGPGNGLLSVKAVEGSTPATVLLTGRYQGELPG